VKKRRTVRVPWHRLDVAVAAGLLLGSAYTAIDVYFDHVIGASLLSTLSIFELFHALIDLVLPAVTGALLGTVLYFTRVRAEMATYEKQRADELAGQIHKIERDQAVWVISASLLHELKTPLHALGLLLDEVADLPDESTDERRALLKRARAQSERLEQHLLTLRSLENARPPEIPEVDLLSCVAGVLDPLIRLAQRQGVVLSVEGQRVQVYVDPNYLRIILQNLVENALDALAPRNQGGHIWVSVKQANDGAEVNIADDGPGVEDELKKRIFDPLFTEKTSGMGLGLSIARGLARSMGGELESQTTEQGASFQLRLRRAEA